MRTSPTTTAALSLIALVFLATLLAGCGSGGDEPAGEAAIRPVKLLVLEEADSARSRRFPAVVQAAASAELTFQVPGQLQEIAVVEAQRVERGQALARLDSRDLQNSRDSAKAQFDNAEAEYQRARRLAEGDAIATSVLEQRETARDTAKAQLETAQKALNDAVLVAPFAGVVAAVQVTKFQNIQPKEPILTIIGEGDREVAIDLPAALVAKSQQAGNANVFVVLDVAPSVSIPAQFKEAALEADSASQTYEVKFRFTPREDLVILPGMNATVIVETPDSTDDSTQGAGIAVPLSAVQNEGDRNYVWVVDTETMKASKRWITILADVGETLIVTEGLVAGETIAGAGAAYLAEDMEVRAWTD